MSPTPYHRTHVKTPVALPPLQQVIWVLRAGVTLLPLQSNFGGCGNAGAEGHCPQVRRAERNPLPTGVFDRRMKNPWPLAGVRHLSSMSTPASVSPLCRGHNTGARERGSLARTRHRQEIRSNLFLLLARVVCMKVKIKPVGGWGRESPSVLFGAAGWPLPR